MKKVILFCLMALSLTMNAQNDLRFAPQWRGEVSPDKALVEQMSRDQKSMNATRQVLPAKRWLQGNIGYWTNGFMLFYTSYRPEYKCFNIQPECGFDHKHHTDPIRALVIKDGKVHKEQDNSTTYSIERLGNYVMLVERNAKGQPLSAYYHVSQEDRDHAVWTLLAQQVFAGNYSTSKGDHAVFGPKMPHYSGESWHTDPGLWATFGLDEDASSIILKYGARRVSHGDPKDPKWNKVPGGGGAGALMGPMEWKIKPTLHGLHVQVARDQQFVDHNPRVEDGSELTFVQSPYVGIPGQWAFASVIPLTHQLLRLFPKEVLTLMRGEIYARHGDTFNDAATQRYFDAQPWYKKSGKPVVLTDIERFNYALIKQVESSK